MASILNAALAPPKIVDVKQVVNDGVHCLLDIRFCKLENRDLAMAMRFDNEEQSYKFHGNQRGGHREDRERGAGASGRGAGEGGIGAEAIIRANS